MKQHWRNVMTVARWEFMRYFKWRQQLVSLIIMGVLIGILYGGTTLMDRYRTAQRFDVAVLGMQQLGMDSGERGRLRLINADNAEPDALSSRLQQGELDGILMIEDTHHGRLMVNHEQAWHDELKALLNTEARSSALQEMGISPDEYASLSQSMDLSIEHHGTEDGSSGDSGTRQFALIVLGLLLFATFNSFAYYFASITTEKQQRVSEQILSAIPAQIWVDGKILGLTALGCKSLINVVLWGIAGLATYVVTVGQMPAFEGLLPPADTALLIIAFGLSGLFFWNAILAAIAATIDDPNSSSRSALMMLPIVPVALVFFALDIPGSPYMVFMSWFPPTSWVAMPARHIMEGVAGWELTLSLLLLIVAVWWVRRAAGKIFAAGMLMYGKEPGLRQLLKTLKQG